MERGRGHGSARVRHWANRDRMSAASLDQADVIVIGAGIVGLSSALELATCGPTCRRRRSGTDRRWMWARQRWPPRAEPRAAAGRPGCAGERRGRSRPPRRRGLRDWTPAPSLWRWIAGFVRSCSARSVRTAAPALSDLARLSMAIWNDWIEATGQPVTTDGLLDVYADPPSVRRCGQGCRRAAGGGVVAVEILDGERALGLEPA